MKSKLLVKISMMLALLVCLIFGAVLWQLSYDWRTYHSELSLSRAETIAQTLLRLSETQDAEHPLTLETFNAFSDTFSDECLRLYTRHQALAPAHIAILTTDGTILAHNDPSLVAKKITNPLLINELGWRHSRTLEDGGLYHVLLPMILTDGLATVDIAFPEALSTQRFHDFLRKRLKILAPALLATIVSLAAIVFVFVLRPLNYLVTLGERMVQGSFIDATQFDGQNDAFSRLGMVFVDFSRYLQDVTSLAQQIALGKLDQQDVQKRSKRDALGMALRDMLEYLRLVEKNAKHISEGDLSINIPLRTETDMFGKTLQQMILSLRKMAEAATAIASGDLREQISPRSEQDVLGNAFCQMTDYLNRLASAAAAIASGNLQHAVLPVTENDVLGNAFQSMAVQLRENFDKIRQEVADRTQAQDALQLLNETLEQRVEERTAEVLRQKYILDSFLENVPDYIYFKDLNGCFSLVNKAQAKHFGVDDPALLVGKNDFDFFSEEPAKAKYDQEREIIRTGEPLLALEEVDFGEKWSLTTKMPLRDERGHIIGTFGISRDITELKQAHQQVKDAYLEIQTLHDRLKDENLRMGAELSVAQRLQEMVLPTAEELRHIKHLDIIGFMQPADEIGGDYYDIIPCGDGHLCLGIGDVTGHGLESGVLMLMAQTAVRTLIAHGENDPVIFLNTLNRVLYQNIQRMGIDKSITLSLVRYKDGELRTIGQHEELLVFRANGPIERVDTQDLGFPIGMVEDISAWIAETHTSLAPGDGIVLYTDGITEAEDSDNQLYGLERLCDVLFQHRHASAAEIQRAAIDDVIRHIGSQTVHDDLTLIVMKRCEDCGSDTPESLV